MNSKSARKLQWTVPDPESPKTEVAEYKGRTITIKDIGRGNFQAIIDGEVNIGGDGDFVLTEDWAMWHIDEIDAGRNPFFKTG